jgi:hypothetical protein
MKHSDIVITSGTVIQIIDPNTGMYLDVTFHPGQTHHALRVIMNGKQYVAYLRLIRIETDDEQDIVVTLRVPAAPSDEPPVRKDVAPHPATVLKPQERTRAAIEAVRANPLPARTVTAVDPNAPHPATVLRPEEVTRAGIEAIRVSDNKPQMHAEHITKQTVAPSEIDREKYELVMSDAELNELRTAVDSQRQKNARRASGGEVGALEPLVDSDVDMHMLDEYLMSDEEIEKLHQDAAKLRDRREESTGVSETQIEFVEDEASVASSQSAESTNAASETTTSPANALKSQDSGKKNEKGSKGSKGSKSSITIR